MSRIVRTHDRTKRPPGRKKPVALEVPDVVTVRDSRRRRASERPEAPDDTKPAPPTPANDDRKPLNPCAIVTIRRKSRFGHVPDLAPEELKRRADLANEMFQDFKRQIAEKIRS